MHVGSFGVIVMRRTSGVGEGGATSEMYTRAFSRAALPDQSIHRREPVVSGWLYTKQPPVKVPWLRYKAKTSFMIYKNAKEKSLIDRLETSPTVKRTQKRGKSYQ